MAHEQDIKQAGAAYGRTHDALIEILTDALCSTYKSVTGKVASDRLREQLFDAVRFEA